MQDEKIWGSKKVPCCAIKIERFVLDKRSVLDGSASGQHCGSRARIADGVDHGTEPDGFGFAANGLNLLVGHALIAARA